MKTRFAYGERGADRRFVEPGFWLCDNPDCKELRHRSTRCPEAMGKLIKLARILQMKLEDSRHGDA